MGLSAAKEILPTWTACFKFQVMGSNPCIWCTGKVNRDR